MLVGHETKVRMFDHTRSTVEHRAGMTRSLAGSSRGDPPGCRHNMILGFVFLCVNQIGTCNGNPSTDPSISSRSIHIYIHGRTDSMQKWWPPLQRTAYRVQPSVVVLKNTTAWITAGLFRRGMLASIEISRLREASCPLSVSLAWRYLRRLAVSFSLSSL